MSKATPTDNGSRRVSQPHDVCETAITVRNKHGRTVPATHRHVARQIVGKLEATYTANNDTINATVVPTATGFNVELPAGTTVGLASARLMSPRSWEFDVLVYSTGMIEIQVITDD